MAREGEEADYESDPEEAMLPLTMRRREASDDEEGDVERREKKPAARVGTGSDVESDGQGGAEAYDDEESEIDEEVEEEEEDVDDGLEEVEFEERRSGGRVDVGEGEVAAVAAADSGVEGRRSVGESGAGSHGSDQGGEEEKKENEPFAVPTAGAFYMHDDRFQENGSGRHRCISDLYSFWFKKLTLLLYLLNCSRSIDR